MINKQILDANCPCGKSKSLRQCCYLAISGEIPAPTAKKLMRSRYTAFVIKDVQYLLATLAPEKHQSNEEALLQEQLESTKWLGLDIKSATQGSRKDSVGQVHFEARFQTKQESGVLIETSNFRRDSQHRWLYIDGDVEIHLDT